MDLNYTDRIYKIIDAQIDRDRFMRILSKIDASQQVTLEFYFYNDEDIDKNTGIVENKDSRYMLEPFHESEFDEIISKFPLIFHGFKVLVTIDLSNMTLDDAIEEIKNKGYGKIIDLEDGKYW